MCSRSSRASGDRTHRILGSSFLITAINLAAAFVGFATSATLASRFGASEEMDALFVAQTLPLLIQAMISTAANYSIIPAFGELESKNDGAGASRTASTLLNCFGLFLLSASLTVSLASTGVLDLIAPGLPVDTRKTAGGLLAIQAPILFFGGVAALLSSVLSSRERYFHGPIALLLSSLVTLTVILLFKKSAGIDAAAIAYLAGSLVTLLFLLPPYLRRYPYRMSLAVRDPAAASILWLMLPLLLGSMFYRAEALVQRFIASFLPTGSISYLGYGFKVITLFATLLSSGLPVVALTHYSAQLRQNDAAGLTETFHSVFKWMTCLVVACVVLVIVCGKDLVQILFMRGRFDAQAASYTYQCLILYSGVLVAGVLGSLITPVFYAHKDVKTTVALGIGGSLLHLILCFSLAPKFSFLGLPLAHSISNVLTVGTMLFVLRAKHLPLRLLSLGRFMLATLLAATVTVALFFLPVLQAIDQLNVVLRLTLKGGSALLTYTLIAIAFGMADALLVSRPQARWLKHLRVCSLAGP